MNFSKKRCWVEINLEALQHNLHTIRAMLDGSRHIMAIVKADAYRHGVLPIVETLATQVAAFGVANVAEAAQIAELVDPTRIFILGPALPAEREEVVRHGFVPVISSFAEATAFNQLVGEKTLPVNVVIDTGMGRIGILENDAIDEVRKIAGLPKLKIKTISTHLPVSDDDENFTTDQIARFKKIVNDLSAKGIRTPLIHMLNSAGAIRFPEHAHDFARVGLALYGSSPLPDFQNQLRAVMTLKTRVTLVRNIPKGRSISYGRTFITPSSMRIATLAAGYADGYPRHLSNQGVDVLVCGRRCPVLGRVTMDQIMVDVSALPDVEAGEEVVLMGRQGSEEIFAADLADDAGTIAWEIFTSISNRVERVCLPGADFAAAPFHESLTTKN